MAQGAFYTGLSGLQAHSNAIEVIGNNLANVNTVGFKSSRANFADFFNVSSGHIGGSGSTNQVGLGTGLMSIQQLFHQGALQPTEVETDLAIQGSGFFNLKTADGLSVYARSGNFSFDNQGFLVNPGGDRLQGYNTRDSAGDIVPTGALSDIQVSTGLTAPPEVTGLFRMDLNLDANEELTNTWQPTVPVYDALGEEHSLQLVFTPVDTSTPADGQLDQWTWEAQLPWDDVAEASDGSAAKVVGSGTITFDGTGKLVTPAANQTLAIGPWANGAAGQNVDWEFYNGSGDPVVTGYAAATGDTSLIVDGYGVGRLHSLSINDDGLINGVFTNGQTLQLSKISMVSFNNPDGLFRRGDNTYMASVGSGAPSVGTAQSGGRGAIISRALELSNVDITEQFTNMIVAERGYQSNSRVITTADEILQETLSIKR